MLSHACSDSLDEVCLSAPPMREREPPLLSNPKLTDADELAPDISKTLFVIPCSKTKARLTGTYESGPSLLDALSPALARRVSDARLAVRERAQLDESALMPAWRRYTGTFYIAASHAIARALSHGAHVIIVSGGYG